MSQVFWHRISPRSRVKAVKLEDQVASLDLCKRLKELGVAQESYFAWYLIERKDGDSCHVLRNGNSFLSYKEKIAAAFTIAELLEGLPQQVNGFELEMFKNGERFGVRYYEQWSEWRQTRFENQWDKNFANALAMMRIYLIENNLVNISAGMEK